ncbi:MAG: hypothetical protein BGO43_02100 [Gammaproteobacteria bacterium 39-13]|nr:LexA family transcriptional regulator [Gammaproteobacteria bacterium]OJV87344.1 MAG: hypothetical protein BGO43_02100 [Gammaproteobacteria bacterium 39-13]
MPLKETPNLKSKICERLKLARTEAGFNTAKEFALLNNLKISTYNLHEAGTRSMALEIIEQYAQILKINVSWLLTGIGPKSSSQVRSIAIIEWAEISTFPEKIDFETKQWTTSDIDLSPFSFALTIDNDAMEPRYPEGTIIIVDTKQKPKNKDFALILIKEKKTPLFKQLIQAEGDLYAKSLNPDYKPIRLTKSTEILGKVVQAKLIC